MIDPQTYLQKLYKHLNALREREARYGGSPPTELLNQIEDHQTAISLTTQFQAGELWREAWLEALRPLTVIKPGEIATQTRPPLQRLPQAEHFTGRKDELEQLLAELQPGRVVTLCGPGGIGKSALAAEAIWRLAPGNEAPERFPDGIFVHSFYNQPQVELAMEAIARAFGEEPKPTPRDAARRVLANKQALLVLDGTEAADDLPALLRLRDRCGVLVTSRDRGDAPAQRQDLAPLPPAKAVGLLQAWTPIADEVVAGQICEQVGGLPLAVRLVGRYLDQTGEAAADYLAWLKETPIQALSHGEHREESVAVLLERSLAQISEPGRQVLGVAGVLALAPFGVEPVAAALETSDRAARQALGELVTYGLLRRDDAGYALSHALIHTYARRRLTVPEPVLSRLAGYYETLARKHRELGPVGFARLDEVRAHLMAVLARCQERQIWVAANNLVSVIDKYLELQGHLNERIVTLKVGLAAAQALNHQQNEGGFLGNLGLAYMDLGQMEQAIEYTEQALAIAQEIGDRRSEGYSMGSRGLAYYQLRQTEPAIKCFKQALAIAREIDDRRSEGSFLNHLGNAYRRLGQIAQTLDCYEQALAIAREIGDRRGEGVVLGGLGLAYSNLGEMGKARDYWQQALEIFEAIQSPDAKTVQGLLDELKEAGE